MSAETTSALPPAQQNSGLSLNKKTIIGICALLVGIMIFAGVLTQVMPRGEYYVYPSGSYQLADGRVVCVPDDEFVYESGDGATYNYSEYCAEISKYTDITVVGQIPSTIPQNDETVKDISGMIIDGTYHSIDYKMPIWKILFSLILVFGSDNVTTGIAIILFIVLIGGTFLILDERGILKYIMAVIIRKFEKKKYFLLCIMVFICMLLSSASGILEESVTLVPIAVAIALALGWDSFVGLGISLVAIAFGFTAATFNPFNVVTVQKLAGVPVFSGLWLRIIIFALVYAVLVGFLVVYAKKIEKNPKKSLSYETDLKLREKFNVEDSISMLSDPKVKKATRAFVLCLCGVIVCIILDFVLNMSGMISMPGMALLFTIGGLTAGRFSGLRGKELLGGFWRGIKTIAPAIPLIFFILAITYILDEGMIIHTILNYVYNLIEGVSPFSAILMLFLFVVVLEFFIGSGTAKAFLIMPIIAPLSQLVGISGNSVVVSFCLADGFTNLLYPTSGIMIIAIGLVNISYGKWLRFSWKLFALEGVVAVAVMLFAVAVNYA